MWKENLYQQVEILFHLPDTGIAPEEDKAQHLLLYIEQHIDQPEQLRLSVLAAKFRLSPTYIGRFSNVILGKISGSMYPRAV